MSLLEGAATLPPSKPQWLWFSGAFGVGLLLLALIPPFQTNDETLHWIKTYSVSRGDKACDKIPIGVASLILDLGYQQVRDGQKFHPLFYDLAFGITDSRLMPIGPENSAACSYPRVGYVIPAVFVRVTQIVWPQRRGAMLMAFFAARLANWLTLSVAVLLLLLTIPQARSWTLFAYSVPMVLHQSVSVNQDATIMALHILLVIAFFRMSGWQQLACIGALVGLLVLMKPIYGPLSLLMAPALWQLTHRGDATTRRRRLIALGVGAAMVLAIAVWRLLPFALLKRHEQLGTPSWTNPGEQVYLMFHQPSVLLAALEKQLNDHLGHGHLTGGFTSILGVFGWCQYEMAMGSYHAMFAAAGLALLADIVRPGGPQLAPTKGWRETLVCRVLPAMAPLPVILLIDIAFWVVFTPPGAPYIIGVQGRYYHGALFLIGIAITSCFAHRRFLDRIRRDWIHHGLVIAAFCCMVKVWGDSINLVTTTYYPVVGW